MTRRLLQICTFALLALTITFAAPVDVDPSVALRESAEADDGTLNLSGSEESSLTLDSSSAAPVEADVPEPENIEKDVEDIVTSTEGVSSSSPSSTTTNDPLENIHLSPKLNSLYQRLSSLDPDLLRSGVIKFRQLLLESKNRDQFLTNLWKDKNPEGEIDDPTELEQFKTDLNELATFISEKHPKILSWFLSTIGGARPETTSQKLSFLEKFSEIDEEMSQYPVWNRYWTYWFQSAGDFIAKYG